MDSSKEREEKGGNLYSPEELNAKRREYEDACLKLSLCGNQRLESALSRLLPLLFKELLVSPPSLVTPLLKVVNEILARLKAAPDTPLPVVDILRVLLEAEVSASSSSLPVVRNLACLFISKGISSLSVEKRVEAGLVILEGFDRWGLSVYPVLAIRLLDCLGTLESISLLKKPLSPTQAELASRVVDAFSVKRTFVRSSPEVAESGDGKRSQPSFCQTARSEPSTACQVLIHAFCELLLIDISVCSSEEQLKEEGERCEPKTGPSTAGCLDTGGAKFEVSRLFDEVSSSAPFGATWGLPTSTLLLWKRKCAFTQQELVMYQTRVALLLVELTRHAPFVDENAIAETADTSGKAATKKTRLPPLLWLPLLIGKSNRFASVSEPCSSALSRSASVVNTEDELYIIAALEMLSVEPLTDCWSTSREEEEQGLNCLLARRTSRMQNPRPPLPENIHSQLTQSLIRSHTAANVMNFSSVLRLQWQNLRNLQTLFRDGGDTRNATVVVGRLNSALDFFLWVLQIQQWFRPERRDDASLSPLDAAPDEARSKELPQHRIEVEIASKEDAFARAHRTLTFVFVAVSQLLLPSALEVASSAETGLFESFKEETLSTEENAKRLLAALSKEAEGSTSTPMRILERALRSLCKGASLASGNDMCLLEARLVSVQTKLILFRKVARPVLSLLLNICATAFRVSPACGVSDEAAAFEAKVLAFFQLLLELLPAVCTVDAAEGRLSNSSATTERKGLTASCKSPTAPLVPPTVQALRSCASWLSRRRAFQGRNADLDGSFEERFSAFLIRELDLAVIRAFALKNAEWSEAYSDFIAASIGEEVKRLLFTNLLPETHAARLFYGPLCSCLLDEASKKAEKAGASLEEERICGSEPRFADLLNFSYERLHVSNSGKENLSHGAAFSSSPGFSTELVKQTIAKSGARLRLTVSVAGRLASLLQKEVELVSVAGAESSKSETPSESAETSASIRQSKKIRKSTEFSSRADAVLSADSLRNFADLLNSLLTQQKDEASSSADDEEAYLTFCKGWIQVVRWSAAQQSEASSDTFGSVSALLSPQIKLLLSQVLFAPLQLPPAASSSEKSLCEEARREASFLIGEFAALHCAISEDRKAAISLVRFFCVFLRGEMPDPAETEALCKTLGGSFQKEAVIDSAEIRATVPSSGEVAGSLAGVGSVLKVFERGNEFLRENEREVAVSAVALLCRHCEFWGGIYCGEKKALFSDGNNSDSLLERLLLLQEKWGCAYGEAVLLHSLRSVVQALNFSRRQLFLASSTKSKVSASLPIIQIDALVHLAKLTLRIAESSLTRVSVGKAVGILAESSNVSQRLAILLFSEALTAAAAVGGLCAELATGDQIKERNEELQSAFLETRNAAFRRLRLTSPVLRSAVALGFVRLFQSLSQLKRLPCQEETNDQSCSTTVCGLLECLLDVAESSSEGSVFATSVLSEFASKPKSEQEAVSGSAVVCLCSILLHCQGIPELRNPRLLRRMQLILAAKVASPDVFVGLCSWRGVPRCLLAALSFPKSFEGEERSERPLHEMLLSDLLQQVAAGTSSRPSKEHLRMQGFSVRAAEEASSEHAEVETAEKALETHNQDAASSRFRLFRLAIQTARDAGIASCVYALFDQPLPPLFTDALCVEACDVAAPSFCLPFLRSLLQSTETTSPSFAETETNLKADNWQELESKDGAPETESFFFDADFQQRKLCLSAKTRALRWSCPPQAAYGLAVYMQHPQQNLRERVTMLVQSVYGKTTALDVAEAAPALQVQDGGLTPWQEVLKKTIHFLQSSNPQLREAACRTLSLLLKSKRSWREARPFLEDLWLSAARCMDDMQDEVRSVATGPVARALRSFTATLCRPFKEGKEAPTADGECMLLVVQLLQRVCELNAGNKGIRVTCLDTLAEAVDCCFEKRKGGVRPESSTDSEWLMSLIPFLIEALAAFEPRSWGHQQFHAESLYGVSAETFEKARVSLSQSSRSAQTLRRVVLNMDAKDAGRVVPAVLQLLRSSVGVNSRCGCCFFFQQLLLLHGEKDPCVRGVSKKIFSALIGCLKDRSSAVRAAAMDSLALSAKSCEEEDLNQIVESKLLEASQTGSGDSSAEGFEESQLAVGRTLLQVVRRIGDRLSPRLRILIAARARVFKHSSIVAVAEVYEELWSEVGSEAATHRLLDAEVSLLLKLLEMQQRRQRLEAARAASALASEICAAWRGPTGARQVSLVLQSAVPCFLHSLVRSFARSVAPKDEWWLFFGFFSEATADAEEFCLVASLWKAVVESLTRRPLFRGVYPLVIAALDLSAALEGLAIEKEKCLSVHSGEGPYRGNAEERALIDGRPFAKAFSQRLEKLSREDRRLVASHFPRWLRLLPSSACSSQPLESFLSVLQKVQRDVEEQISDSDSEGASDDADGEAASRLGRESTQSQCSLSPKKEAFARAALQALLSFSCLDLCMQLGREGEFAEVVEDSAEGKGVASGEAVMIKSHPYPHPGVVALLRLASEYRVASFQFKLFAMQITQRLVAALTRLDILLSDVANLEDWKLSLTFTAENLQTRRHPRLHCQAAALALAFADHFLQVACKLKAEATDTQAPTEAGHEEANAIRKTPRNRSDIALHADFEASLQFSLADVSLDADDNCLDSQKVVRGTWSVFAQCLAAASSEAAEDNAILDQDEKAPVTEQQPAFEANRLLRIRLQDALDKSSRSV